VSCVGRDECNGQRGKSETNEEEKARYLTRGIILVFFLNLTFVFFFF
jgi:hypothetical protein